MGDGNTVGGHRRPDHFVMYNATVRALPFAAQCRAAALADCTELTMTPNQYLDYLATGMSTRDIRAIATDHGVTIAHLDPLARWTPKWKPDDDIEYPVAFEVDDFLRMCDALGCRSFTAIGTHPRGTLGRQELIDCFGVLCERAAGDGLRVDLEFAPLWGLATLEDAWAIVQGAAAPNSGIMLDMWHFRRSQSSEALLASIPGERITGVQLNDGDIPLRDDVGFFADCLFGRRPAGTGDFRVGDIIAVLERTGGLNNVGPEIFSSAFDTLPAEDIARQCRRSVAKLFA